MVTCSYDTNTILVRLLKTRMRNELVCTVKSIYDYLAQWGYKPKHHIMDNETSIKMREYLKGAKVTFQFVLTNLHRVNATERVI